MDKDVLEGQLNELCRNAVSEARAAVQQAPDGQWIAASEWQVREAFQTLMAQAFERVLQAKLDAAEAGGVFSPCGFAASSQQRQTRGGRAQCRR